MSEWQTLNTAPLRIPIRVWANYNPNDSLFTWREMIAIQKYENWWYTYGKNESRCFPTHWKPFEELPK